MDSRESLTWATRNERREKRRRNSRKHGVSGRSFIRAYANAIIKRAEKANDSAKT